MKKYDVILIGTGSANIIADAAIVQGLSVAIIERGSFGGTCLNRGCIPTKVMVTAASRIREIREGGRIGVFADNARLDWDILSKRLWEKSMKANRSRLLRQVPQRRHLQRHGSLRRPIHLGCHLK